MESLAAALRVQEFQLTAARRRLVMTWCVLDLETRFNSQPPEGGWRMLKVLQMSLLSFNSQPPEGGWVEALSTLIKLKKFQLTAARRRLGRTNRTTTRGLT